MSLNNNESTILTLDAQIDQRKHALVSLANTLTDTKKELVTAKYELGEAEKRKKYLEEQIESLTGQEARLRIAVTTLEKNQAELTETNRKLARENGELKQKNEEATASLEASVRARQNEEQAEKLARENAHRVIADANTREKAVDEKATKLRNVIDEILK